MCAAMLLRVRLTSAEQLGFAASSEKIDTSAANYSECEAPGRRRNQLGAGVVCEAVLPQAPAID